MDYYYESEKRMFATARQMDGCAGRVHERIYGTKGIAYLNDRNDIVIRDLEGNVLWEYDYEAKPVKNPYVQEHIHLVESIRLGLKINQAEELAYSTQIAIQGREAAYTGKAITWDEIMASDLKFGPETYALGPLPFYKEGQCPVPGAAPNPAM